MNVVYVGKGQDGRAWTWNRKRDKNPRLCAFIDRLRSEGKKPYVLILRVFDTETECFAAETAFIKEYGRLDLGTGSLLNCSDGGAGNSKFRGNRFPQSAERRVAASERMKKLNADPAHQDKAHHKKRTDPATKAVLSARMQRMNETRVMSDEERAARAANLAHINRTRAYSPEERRARSERTAAMNAARKAAKHG